MCPIYRICYDFMRSRKVNFGRERYSAKRLPRFRRITGSGRIVHEATPTLPREPAYAARKKRGGHATALETTF